ncbi:MAG: nidogen-like domain-containing protein, partial [Planctomycetales bacterium]
MYLKPLTKFLKSLVNGDRFRYRWIRRPLSERQRRYASVLSGGTVANPAQLLEERSLLSAQLVSVIPNTGGFIYNGTTQNVVQTEAPRELKLTFSPGAAITNTPSNLAAISVTRAGGDGTFGNSSDQPVTLGFIGVAAAGDQSNQVTLRFADTLPDDTYRVTITSSLKTTTGDSFAGPLNVDFKVDYGSQVVSVVPQPVVRIESLNVLNVAKISDGDRVALTAGGTTVTFEFDSNNSVGQGNKGIAFTQADTRAVLAGKITTAINAANSGLNGIIAATTNGTSVNLEGAAFTPTAKITAAQAGGVSYTEVATGGLVQKRDTIVAYFNQNPLDPTLAQDPGFYRAINTADGSILLPQSVLYSSVSNSAVLKFATDLPTGTWNLKIGAPNVHQNTLATAINQGTLFSNTGGATIYGFLGNLVGTSVSKADVDLYQFSVVSATTVDINASNLAPGLAGSLALRLFDAQGNEVAFEPAGTSLSASIAAGTYYLGISSPNNDAYNPVNGDDAIDGIGFGSYKLNLSVNTALPNVNNAAADTTSFGTASNVGVLGAAGQVVDDRIAPLGNLAYPTLPGGADEPGHRDIGAVVGGESNSGSYLGSSVPGSIPVYYYNFQDVYGFDPQGNTLHNAITENQKQRAREIFDIFGRSIGKKFVETSASGLTVVTGDIRAVAPGVPPDAVGGIAGGGKVIMNANLNYGSSEYGGSWFGIAFHEIGHALGLEHSYDVPGVMGQGVGGGSGVEPVYPGDINLVPVMSLNPPNSTDINVYQFQVPQGGTFTGEVVAQRRVDGAGKPNPSLLDSALTLYKQDYTLAEALSDFGTNGAVQLKFVAKPQGTAGNGISLAITKADLGASVVPTISVVGNQINVVLNTNAVGGTTAQKLVDAINNDANAKLLVTALLPGGGGTVNVASPSITYSPITLLGGTTFRTIVARNDDYFGRDSFLNLHLDQGTYFLAVSSTGNTAFDPTVSFTGFGGRTDGDYRLNMNFTPDPATSTTLNDAGGRALDGDGNAAEGGTFNFWFRSNTDANTIYVDKANSASVNQNGSLGNPFATISAALAAANQGQVVRIVGNGGTDNDLGTINDARPYLIGFDSQNKPAADGTTFVVPKDVTVMIDAGALFKLQGAVIDAGNTVPNISRSGGALQILGTPTNQVHFTSLRDNSKGGNTDPTNFTGVQRGNWGGLVFRQESDVQGLDYRGQGIFLNSVNQANFQYGGGQVLVDSVLQIFNPVHITNPNGKGKFFARPTVWFNTITNSADAAISVDPNSFYNSLDRVGPDIHGNRVIDNTINGLFIRIRTNLGEPVDKLEVPARIDESDITYVLSENLFIKGTPGGPLLPNPNDATRTGWDARVAGSLVIDPGVIFKQSASRIEAQVGGSQLIAEGTLAHRVIFTSLKDDSYGAGGTFDTGADGLTTGTAGDYGGLMFNATSSGSIDQARITFAGGTTPIAGGFTQFNPVEIQQAHVRVANTLFQNNSDGILGGDQDPSGSRNGLLNNGSAALFVRGAQPVIVKNTFVGNKGDIISVNVNALNSFQMADWGRSTGAIDDFEEFVNNHGPLVRLNTYANNTSNGMKVRAETITAESVWDDTDIVHIVSEEINDNVNLHTYGGIRLQSTPDASLVVKLRTGAEGSVPDQPGFNANTLAANDDGFTGLVPIGFPVNFYGVTSSQLYVNNNGAVTFDAPLPTFTPFDLTSTGRQIIAPFFGDVDTRSAGSPVTYGTGTVGGRPAFGVNWLNVDYFSSSTTHTNRNDFRLIMVDRSDVAVGDFDFAFLYYKIQWETGGASGGDSNGLGGFSARAGYSNGTGAPGTFFEIPGSAINGAFLDNNLSTGLIHNSLNSSILGQYIFHVRGGSVQPTGAGIVVNGTPLDIDDRIGGTLQVIGTPGHPVVFTSFRDDTVGAGFRPDGQPQLDTNGDGIVGVDLSALQPQAGDWNGLVLDKYSNDRNVSSYIESEQISNRQNVNATPGTAEFVGSLAPGLASDNPNNAKGGNDDQTVGFEIQGYLNSSTDADLYSFNATAGTEVWFDISRTSSSLNTVLELVDANGQVLAGSDDSAEDTTLVSTVSATARNLIKDPMLGGDFYTTNPRDAGFRVVLPGQPGVAGTYFILVRSKDAQTQGEYRLQVRLQQVYEHPGSTIRFADIRYAVNGIQVRGLSNHSPLSGDSTSIGTNNSFANAQGLGNLLTSNNNTISVSGALNSAAQVDWYKFDLNYDLIQSIGGVNGADKTWSTIFDIDYADGIARGDLTLAVYDKTGRLVMMGRDSNVVDDQPGALQGNGLNDLSRGSVGKNDPFIGPVMLPAGTPSGNTGSEGGSGGPSNGSGGTHTYYVAVMSNVVVPTALDMYYRATATNSLIRLEPVNSVKRVVEDHIGFIGHTTGDRQLGSIKVNPTTPAILPVATGAQLGVSVRPYSLTDVVLYANTPGDSQLHIVNPFTGAVSTDQGVSTNDVANFSTLAIQMRSDGTLWGYQSDRTNDQNVMGRFVRIDPATGAQTIISLDGIPEYNPQTAPPDP